MSDLYDDGAARDEIFSDLSIASGDWSARSQVEASRDEHVVSPVDNAVIQMTYGHRSIVHLRKAGSHWASTESRLTLPSPVMREGTGSYRIRLGRNILKLRLKDQPSTQPVLRDAKEPEQRDNCEPEQQNLLLGGAFAPSRDLVQFWINGHVQALITVERSDEAETLRSTRIDATLQHEFSRLVTNLIGKLGQQLRYEGQLSFPITEGRRFSLLLQNEIVDRIFVVPDETSFFLRMLSTELRSINYSRICHCRCMGRCSRRRKRRSPVRPESSSDRGGRRLREGRASWASPLKFRLIQLSDFHFCTEVRRNNFLTLNRRMPSSLIDTVKEQVDRLGVVSLLKPASYVPEVISGVAEFCLRRSLVNDALVISGDLATTGIAIDIAVASQFVSAQTERGFRSGSRRPTLQAAELPIYVLPGNHDQYVDDEATPGSRNFTLAFSKYMPEFRNGVADDRIEKNGRSISIVFADFSVRHRRDCQDPILGPYGQGRVYDDVLRELVTRTSLLRRERPGTFVLWVIHFAPFDCGYKLELMHWPKLQRAAIRNKVELVLCGHTHEVSKVSIGGVSFYCSGSSGSVDSEFDHWVHEIEVELDTKARITRKNYRWNESASEFAFVNED